MNIFITMPLGGKAPTFLTEKSLAELEKLGNVRRNPYTDRQLTKEEVVEMAQDADVIITGWGSVLFEKKDVEQMPNLKLIAHTAGTVAPVVAQDVYDLGIAVMSGNDVFAQSVAEGCLCYTLAALRRMEASLGIMRAGGWKNDSMTNRGLIGKKVGLVGFGTIAKHFLELIRWFRCDVLVHSSHLTDEEAAKYGVRTASLEEIFSQCDVVSLHLARTPKTKGMITEELLKMLKPDALLVNTSRGSVIDEPAMYRMLHEGKFYAALDVYDVEPPLADDPIRQCKNVLLMPHQAGPTIDMREVVVLELAKDIERFFKGEPTKHTISKEAAGRMTR